MAAGWANRSPASISCSTGWIRTLTSLTAFERNAPGRRFVALVTPLDSLQASYLVVLTRTPPIPHDTVYDSTTAVRRCHSIPTHPSFRSVSCAGEPPLPPSHTRPHKTDTDPR